MSREELVPAVAGILFAAFLIGWFAHWLVSRLTRTGGADSSDLEKLAHDLHDAEETRDQAVAYFEKREADLTNKLQQTEAELQATMDGLQAARSEVEALRAQLSGGTNTG